MDLLKGMKREKNPVLEQHGPTGYFMVRLSRYAVTGWIAFFLSLTLFIFYVAIDKLVPVPVIAVDSAGRVLGTMEYLDPTTRTDEEVIAGAKHFLDSYTSLNSSTIYNDNAAALSMMSEALRDEKLESLISTNFLKIAEQSQVHSFNEYDEPNGAMIISSSGLDRSVRLVGNIVITPKNGETIEKPFDVTLELTIIPRNTFVTTGLMVTSIRDN